MDALDLTAFLDKSPEELIAILASVTNLRINAANLLALHQRDYDRTLSNRYFQSEATSHAAKFREAEYYAQDDKDDVTDYHHQVAVHALTAEFLTSLIDWRTRGIESSSRLQGRERADSEARRRVEGGRERDLGGRSTQGIQVREEAESTLEPSVS